MNAIELRQVKFQAGSAAILGGIDWQVPPGARAAVLGPNGCGKSTLLRLITGYLFPTEGTVRTLGHTLGEVEVHRLRRAIGVVDPGGPFPPEETLSALEVVLTGFFGNLCLWFSDPTQEQRAAADQALKSVGLAAHAGQNYRTLSTGEQRRLLLARAMVQRPRLLVLDEPTAGLDLLGRETMLATLDRLVRRAPELTTVMVTHHLEELSPRTDQVLLLAKGSVVASGRPEEVLTSDKLSLAFGCRVDVDRVGGRWRWSVQPSVWQALAPSGR